MSSQDSESWGNSRQHYQYSDASDEHRPEATKLKSECFQNAGRTSPNRRRDSPAIQQESSDFATTSDSPVPCHYSERGPASQNAQQKGKDRGDVFCSTVTSSDLFPTVELDPRMLPTNSTSMKGGRYAAGDGLPQTQETDKTDKPVRNRSERSEGTPLPNCGTALRDGSRHSHSPASSCRGNDSLVTNGTASQRETNEESCDVCGSCSTHYVSVSLGLSEWETLSPNQIKLRQCFDAPIDSIAVPSSETHRSLAHEQQRQLLETIMQKHSRKRIKRVTDYILGPICGEGTLSTVRDAINISSNNVDPFRFQRVAIKCYKQSDSKLSEGAGSSDCSQLSSLASATRRQQDELQRLREAEKRNLQCFYSTNIVRSIDVFSHEGKQYIVQPAAICNLEQLVQLAKCQNRCASCDSVRGRRNVIPSSKDGVDGRFELMPSLGKPAGKLPQNDVSPCTGAASLQKMSPYRKVTSLFAAEVVRSIMNQLLRGVAYLHRQGVAHNDLKPQNILLFADGLVKIGDLASVSVNYTGHGTPMYLSPEICRYFYDAGNETNGRVAVVDALKNDMWGCGAILYYLLTGNTLWEDGANCQNVYQLYRIIAERNTPVSLSHINIPAETEDELISRLTESENISFRATGGLRRPTAFPHTSLLHLAAGLLDVNPATRLTAEEAVRHPSLQAPPVDDVHDAFPTDMTQEDVMKVMLESPYYQQLIKWDRERHLQFAAECSHVLGLQIPEEICISAQKRAADGCGMEADVADPLLRLPSSIYRLVGTVNPSLFLPTDEFHHYLRKLKVSNYDVSSLRANPSAVKMMEDYLHTVMMECGYTGSVNTRDRSGTKEDQDGIKLSTSQLTTRSKEDTSHGLATFKDDDRSETLDRVFTDMPSDGRPNFCCIIM
ncbi:protein kinase, putative [Trypanosoma brucei gambiense DAL972]|uniref:Protein kinase, putative n=1 Tax=Trypanosoma brucei gambiense (strain MHOM/CI/86/DAL972) TaxID=679716 RepID=D0A243_TRYB9|nr:protein kinase, putative [Trypanosoma brucei gambiense DAL972]CBH15336.1 protein kinase, putative [Trypanosoma brucei gambiense DAL972]|eukprot:XP_011777601.1 protein kinase, putative [Trypanosoma brucei gambiense DAL972]